MSQSRSAEREQRTFPCKVSCRTNTDSSEEPLGATQTHTIHNGSLTVRRDTESLLHCCQVGDPDNWQEIGVRSRKVQQQAQEGAQTDEVLGLFPAFKMALHNSA